MNKKYPMNRKPIAQWLFALSLAAVLSNLSGCAATDTKSAALDDAAVQNHALYGGDVNKASLQAERYKAADSGTRFDKKSKKGADEKREHVEKGNNEYRDGNYDIALYEYVRALVLDPKDSELYYKVGVLHAANGNLPLAALALQKATELQPQYIPALDLYGELNLRLRRYDIAANYFQRAIDLDRNRLAKLKNGGTVDANSPFNSYNGMGVIEDIRGNFDAAQTDYAAALQIRPSSAELVNNMGYSHYLHKDFTRAEACFRQAISFDSNFAKAWYNLALIYVRKEQYDDAIALLTDRTGDPASARNTVGYLSMLAGKRVQAESFFTQAIELSPTYFDLAYQNRERNRLLNAGENN